MSQEDELKKVSETDGPCGQENPPCADCEGIAADEQTFALIEQLATRDCNRAYAQLAEMGSVAVPALSKALPYSPFPVRIQIVRLLAESLDKEALPALAYARATACWQVRLEAARAMQTIYLHHFIIGACWFDDPEDELLAE